MPRVGGGMRSGGFGGGGGFHAAFRPSFHPAPTFHRPATVYHHPQPTFTSRTTTFHPQTTFTSHSSPYSTSTFHVVPVVSSSSSTSYASSSSSYPTATSYSSSASYATPPPSAPPPSFSPESVDSDSNSSSEDSSGSSSTKNNATTDIDGFMSKTTSPSFYGDANIIHPPLTAASSQSSPRVEIDYEAKEKMHTLTCWSRFFCVFALLFATLMTICVAASRYSDSIEVADIEQVLITPSTTWRSFVRVTPLDSQTQSFLLSKTPSLTRNDALRNESQTIFVPSDSYRYLAYRLLQGSKISMKYTSKSQNTAPDFYLIEGKNLFESWENGAHVTAITLGATRFGSIDYTVKKTEEDLYFVWEQPRQSANEIYTNFTLDLMLFDSKTNLVRSCSGVCDFDLEYRSNQVVLVSPFITSDVNHVQTITWSVSPRYGPFAAVGGSISGFFALLALALYLNRLWIERQKNQREKAQLEAIQLEAAKKEEFTLTPGEIVYPPTTVTTDQI